MKKTLFIKNTAILTFSSVLLRLFGIVFKVYVASKLGSVGMGLYGLVFSVFIFASSFAATGISTAVTCLGASASAKGRSTSAVLRCGITLSFLLSLFIGAALFLSADLIAKSFIGDIKASLSLKIIPVSLIPIGISACFRGFFIAERKASPCAVSQIIEQSVRIPLSAFLVSRFSPFGAGICCACLVAGDTVAESVCCFYLFLRYRLHRKKHADGLHKTENVLRNTVSVALPLTAGKYLSSLLRTAENMIVPKRLSGGKNAGLSFFGNMKGMALPIILFPMGLLSGVTTLLVPELSRARAKNMPLVVRSITERILKLCMLFSVFLACFFAFSGDRVGELLYKSREVGVLLIMLSPIVPLMYIDAVSDGILRGLGAQKFCFAVGILDSGLRVVLCLVLLKKYGAAAFIGITYFSNLLTAFLNTGRLIKETGAKIDLSKTVFLPLCAALLINKTAALFISKAGLGGAVYLLTVFTVSAALYAVFLFLCEKPERVLDVRR